MRISNINGNFLNVISGKLARSILFKCFFNDFLYITEIANAHNFVDDNALTDFVNNIQNLIHLLESENSLAIKLFKENKMVVNPGNFQAIILDKKNNNYI